MVHLAEQVHFRTAECGSVHLGVDVDSLGVLLEVRSGGDPSHEQDNECSPDKATRAPSCVTVGVGFRRPPTADPRDQPFDGFRGLGHAEARERNKQHHEDAENSPLIVVERSRQVQEPWTVASHGVNRQEGKGQDRTEIPPHTDANSEDRHRDGSVMQEDDVLDRAVAVRVRGPHHLGDTLGLLEHLLNDRQPQDCRKYPCNGQVDGNAENAALPADRRGDEPENQQREDDKGQRRVDGNESYRAESYSGNPEFPAFKGALDSQEGEGTYQ